METGTFGHKAPDDQAEGVEQHAVCMLAGDVAAGLAESAGEGAGEGAVGEMIVVGMLAGDVEGEGMQGMEIGYSSRGVVRCERCGGQVERVGAEDFSVGCQECREPQ